MPRFASLVVFTLIFAVVVAFPQPNSDDSPAAVVAETPADTPEASALPAEGESVDLRFRPSYGYGGQQYGGQQYGSNYYSSERYESHYSNQQYGHQNYGHQNYGHQNYGHNGYGNYGHGYNRPYGYGGYPGGYGYYGRPQGILGTVGNVLDGLLGLREGEKKPAVDGDASAAPVVAAVDPAAAVVPEADSVPQIPVAAAILPETLLPESEGVSPGGEEVIFQ